MSKPVPVYEDSPRPCSPTCALHQAPQCLAASQVALPVHGVSTTRVTTQELPAYWGRRFTRSGLPLGTRMRDQRIWPRGITVTTIANVHPFSRAAGGDLNAPRG